MHVLSEKYIFNINNTEQLIIRHLRTTRLFRDVVISLLGKSVSTGVLHRAVIKEVS